MNHLASIAFIEDRANILLVVTAAAVGIVHGVTGVPQHDTRETLLGLDGVDEGGHGLGIKVVWVWATLVSITRSCGSRGHTEVERSTLGGSLLNLVEPVVPSSRNTVGVIGRAAGVVIELDVKLVEFAGGDHVAHVWLTLGALRSTSNDVLAVTAEVLAESVNGIRVDLVVIEVADFNIKVEPVERGAIQRLVASATTELVPQRVSEFLAVAGIQLRVVDSTPDGAKNLLTVRLASLDVLANALALVVSPFVFAFVGGVSDTGPVEVANSLAVCGHVSILIDEGEDNGVDTLFGRAHISQRLLLNLTPVNDLLKATGWRCGVCRIRWGTTVSAAGNARSSRKSSAAHWESWNSTGSASKDCNSDSLEMHCKQDIQDMLNEEVECRDRDKQ